MVLPRSISSWIAYLSGVALAGIGYGALAVSQAGLWWEQADVVNHFLPLWLPGVALLAAAAFLLAGRRRRSVFFLSAGLVAAAIIVGWRQIIPEFGPAAVERSAAPASASAIRIVSFNLWKDNRATERAAEWLAASGADLVILLEASEEAGRTPMLLQATYPYQVDCAEGPAKCSTMILSKTKPIDARGLAARDPQNRKSLSAALGEYCLAGRRISVMAVHLSRPWPFPGQKRDMRDLVAHVSAAEANRLILAGDFNLTPWSFAFRRLERSLPLMRATRAMPTWPADAAPWPPVLPLDHVYYGRDLRVDDVTLGPANGSDHRPVVSAIRHAGPATPENSC